MSNGDDDPIIICGTGGEEQGTVNITMFKGSVLGVALAFSVHAAEAYPGVSHRDALRLKRMIERDYERWGEELDRLGIPYQRHQPHPLPPQ